MKQAFRSRTPDNKRNPYYDSILRLTDKRIGGIKNIASVVPEPVVAKVILEKPILVPIIENNEINNIKYRINELKHLITKTLKIRDINELKKHINELDEKIKKIKKIIEIEDLKKQIEFIKLLYE